MSMIFQDYKEGHHRFLFNSKKTAHKFLDLNDLDYDVINLKNGFFLLEVATEVVEKLGGLDTELDVEEADTF